MKTILLFLAAMAVSSAAEAPKFLLVWQKKDIIYVHPYTGSVALNASSEVTSGITSVPEIFSTREAMVDRLKRLLGAGNSMSLVKPDDIVGIWRLDDGARIPLRVWKETRVIPEHVAERKVEELKVEIGGVP